MRRATASGGTVNSPTGPAGSVGATARTRGGVVKLGDEMYLWLLVALELLATVALRNYFKSAHGG